ncbi:MAG: PD40 domain-containing protein [Bacteroidales bacterium]|nr:PD40 domain-containing protein [Bacteroidales bacterium]
MRRRLLSILFAILASVPGLRAQTDSLLREGERLHRQYRFEEAMERFVAAASFTQDADTLERLRARMRQTQNALNLTDFCADPVVVARQRFSRRDFFLFYPLKNQGWRAVPNSLDPSEDGFPTYAPKGERVVYFSAPDEAGSRNLYVTRDQDTLWSAPELMGEKVLSIGNEVFPMVSADGKTLTFASDGLYGTGGYDLYRSTWDEEAGAWGEPENLGFPYSSPGDDFLLSDTPDGRYVLFASNRDCSRDSVYIYVLEKQKDASRVPVRDPEVLARMAALAPVNDPTRLDHGSAVADDAPGNDNTRLYRERMDEVRALRDTIYVHERVLDDLRVRRAADVDGQTDISLRILDQEALLVTLKAQLEDANKALRSIEQSFLRSGAVPASDRADREVVGARSSYTFSKKSFGARLKMRVAQPQLPSEGSFKIAPVGRFAQGTALPVGVVYQIQLFTSARHATLDEIKGLSPVYERITSSLRYTYSVGVFRTFGEALRQLNAVRHLGFPDAQIVAFTDGRPVPVADARRAE